jgi:predicted membrane protein
LQSEIIHVKLVIIMSRRTFIGIIFIVAALLKLADMWNLVCLDWLWQQPWTNYIAPVFLLYVGGMLLINSYRRDRDQWLQRPIPVNEDGKRIRCAVSFGGDEYVYRGEAFHGARLDASFGGIRLDLRDAIITEDEEIDIHTFIGGVELFVPSTVNVVVKSRSIFGAVGNETLRNDNPQAHYLHVVASNIIGGVSIKNC